MTWLPGRYAVHLDFIANAAWSSLFHVCARCSDETHVVWEIWRDVSCSLRLFCQFRVLLASVHLCQLSFWSTGGRLKQRLADGLAIWGATEILWPHPNADTEVVCRKKSDWRLYENPETSFRNYDAYRYINKSHSSCTQLIWHALQKKKKKVRFKNTFEAT